MKGQTKPLVSIVMPSFNQQQFIEEAIQSIVNQDYPNLELIVIDGGSTDGTLEILKRYDSQLHWISEPDNGQSHAINKGFKRAQGEIVAWLNSDDFYAPGAVRTAVDELVNNPDIGAVYGYAGVIDDQGDETHVLKSPEYSRERLFSTPDFIMQPTVFMRKSVLDQVGLLDESLHYVMDYDLWLRIGRVTDFKLIPTPLAGMRFHVDAKSVAQSKKFWPELRIVYDRYEEINISRIYRALRNIRLFHALWDRLRSPRLLRLRDRLFGFKR
ncbi:MAG TPA: glycosyltransferase [Actinobacteria bacterium]|nr:glycosyltransferase [Actinomycetota bacterium]